MTSEQINMFISTAKTLNFTETANEFHTTQPTVSRQIHWLEEEWGIKLFERVKKNMVLTPEGMIMFDKCLLMSQILENGLLEARNVKNGYKGTLKIGVFETIDENEIMLLVEQFEKRHPDIQVQIEMASFGPLREALDKRKVDIIFTLNFESQNLKDVVGETFRKEKAVFVISKRHPLYAKKNLSYCDFEGIDFVFPNSSDSPGREADTLRFFKELNLKNNEITLVPNSKTVLHYVRSGKAATLLDTSIEEIKRDEYRIVELPQEVVPGVEIMAFWKQDNRNPCIPLLYNSDLFCNTK